MQSGELNSVYWAFHGKDEAMVPLLLVVVGTIAFEVLTLLYGVDSRNTKALGLRSDWNSR